MTAMLSMLRIRISLVLSLCLLMAFFAAWVTPTATALALDASGWRAPDPKDEEESDDAEEEEAEVEEKSDDKKEDDKAKDEKDPAPKEEADLDELKQAIIKAQQDSEGGVSDAERKRIDEQLKKLQQAAIKSKQPSGKTPKAQPTQPTKVQPKAGKVPVESKFDPKDKAYYDEIKRKNAGRTPPKPSKGVKKRGDNDQDDPAAEEGDGEADEDANLTPAERRKKRLEEQRQRRLERIRNNKAKNTEKGGQAGKGDQPARASTRRTPATSSNTRNVRTRRTPTDAAMDGDSDAPVGTGSPIGELADVVIIDIETRDGSNTKDILFEPNDMPWVEIVEDLARIRGVPYIDNPDAMLEGNLTYFTDKRFTYRELFNKLNELLLDQPLNNMIIRDLGDRITVERIPDAMRKIPVEKIYGTFEEFEAANLPLYDICVTQFKTPDGWTAGTIIENYRPEFSDTYGVEPLDQYTIQLTGLVKEHFEFRKRINRLTEVEENISPGLGKDAPVKIELKHVKAADMQTLLRQLYPVDAATTAAPTATNNRRRGRRGRNQAANNIAPELDDTDAISIIVDAINNVLYIKAPDMYLEAMLATIRSIDVPSTSPPRIESVQVNNAPAEDVVNLIQPLLAEMKQELAGDKRTGYVDPKILEVFDVNLRAASGNSIIMVGGAEGNKEARRLIAQYDVQPDWINRTFILQYRDAADIVEEVQNALPPSMGAPVVRAPRGKKGAAPAARGSAGPDPVFVIRSSRELYVSATRFDMDRIAERVAEFDRPDPDAPTERFVEFTCAIPSEVAETLAQLLRDDDNGPQVVEAKGKSKAKTAAQRRAQARARARGRSTKSGGDGPVMIAKDGESRLLILCSDQDWAEMKPLIDELEKNACEIEPIFVEIPLENADPTDLASTLNQMFPANGGEDLMITADAFNKRIRMWAKPAFIDKVRPLIAKLDINVGAEMTVIRLEYSKAELIAPIIKQAIPGTVYQAPNIRSRRTNNRRTNNKKKNVKRATATVKTEGETTVTVTAEPFTNSLLVTAPPEKLEQIQRLITDIEAEAKENAPYTETITVQNRKAEDLATVLKSILATPTTAPGGESGGKVEGINAADVELAITAIGERLIIAGPRKEVDEAIKLTLELDVADPEPIIRKVRTYDAEEDKKFLEQLLSDMQATEVQVVTANSNDQKNAKARNRRTRGRQPQKTKLSNKSAIDDIRIVANTFENTLLIRALPKDWPLIERCLRIISGEAEPIEGTGDGPGKKGDFFTIELVNRDAWDISYDLDTFYNIEGRRPVEFLEGPQEKILIVRNFRPDEVEDIKTAVKMWDVSKDGGNRRPGIITVKLKGKELPETMARKLQSQSDLGVPIEISELSGMSRVEIIDIHAGEEDDEAKPAAAPIKKTSADKDDVKPSAKAKKDDETPISSLSPTSLPLWLRQVAVLTALGQTPESSESPNVSNDPRIGANVDIPVDKVQIITDSESGQLIFIGDNEKIIQLEDLVAELIPDDPTTVIRVFPLKYADVRSAAQLLNDVFNQPAQRRAPTRRQPQPKKGGDKGGDDARAKALAQAQAEAQAEAAAAANSAQQLASARIKVVPDERTSSLYVVAPLPDIPLIIEVLKRIDSKDTPPPLDFRMFELKELDATQVVENLKDVLGINQARTAARGRTPQRGNNRNQRGNQQNRQVQLQKAGGDATTIAADKTKLTAVTQTNTIIAQGPTPTLDMIEKIINDLESLKVVDVEVRPIKLQHARASEIAEIAQSLIDETINSSGPQAAPAGGRGRGRGRAPAAANTNKENVSSHADTRTNSIILVGPSTQLTRAQEIVESFDVDITGIVYEQIPVKGEPGEIANTLRELFQVPSGRGAEANDIVITPLNATSCVIVKAPAPQMEEIKREIATINDSIGETKAWRTIKMQFADAETVANNLSEIFGSRGGRRGRGGPTTTINIKGFSTNNTIYVQAADEDYAEIEKFAKELDQIDTSITVSRFQLKHAAAQQVLSKIQTMIAGARSPDNPLSSANLDYVSLEADPRTNSLILVGGPKSRLLLEQMLKEVDIQPDTPLQRVTTNYKLPTNVDVNQVVRNINEMFRNEDLRTTGKEKPVVTANPGANLVVVVANEEQHTQIKKVIDDVSQGGQQGERKRHLYALENAKAPDLSRVLNEYIRNNYDQVNRKYPITVLAEEGTNKLIVNASDDDYEGFQKLIAELDKPGGERTTKVFRVKYVSPWNMERIINQQFRDRGSRNPNDQVTANFEDGTFSLIVTANEENMAKVEKLIADADLPGDQKVSQFVKLQHGQADEMRNTIDQALRGKYPSDRRGQTPFSVTADGLSNQLLVSARENIMPEILEMIENFDVPGAKEKTRRVFKLKYVDPGAVSRMVQQLFRPQGRRPSPNESVECTDDWTTNSVIVAANPENMQKIADLINELDQVGDGPRKERVITVKNADPNDVAQTVQAIFREANRGQRGQSQSPVLRAVRGSNKMIAFANDKEFEQIEALVKAVDEEGSRAITAMVMEPRIPVRSVAESINNLYGGGGRGRGNSEGPRAEFHEPTNTLFVYATEDEYDKIFADIITPVSTATPVEAQMHFIKVKNAVAEDVAATLQDFFDKKAGINGGGRGRGRFGRRGGGGQASSDEDRIVINADAQSNTLIVYCTDEIKAEIDQLLSVIDSESLDERVVEIAELQYVNADVMIDILTEVLRVNRGSAANDQSDLPWWARRDDEDDDETVLAGDTRLKAINETNSIIVAGKPDAVENAMKQIEELDKPGGTDSQYIQLTCADASVVAEIANEVFAEQMSGRSGGGNNRNRGGRGRRGRGRSSSPASSGIQLSIVPNQEINTLIVSGRTSDVNKVAKLANDIDERTCNEGRPSIQVLAVPLGVQVSELADSIESVLNAAEEQRAAQNSNYVPDLVTVTPETRSNSLIVAVPNDEKLQEIQALADQLIARNQAAGAPVRVVVPVKAGNTQTIKEIIEEIQRNNEESSGTSSNNRGRNNRSRGNRGGGNRRGNNRRGGRGGRRGDANWTHNRRYEAVENAAREALQVEPTVTGEKKSKKMLRNTTIAATLPVFMMNVALQTAVAQTDKPNDANKDKPRSIRLRQPPKRHDKKDDAAKKSDGGKKDKQDAANDQRGNDQAGRRRIAPPRARDNAQDNNAGRRAPQGRRAQPKPELPPEVKKMVTDRAGQIGTNINQESLDAISARLSGSPINVIEAPDGSLIIEGLEEDVATITNIIQMIDAGTPEKDVEFILLKNALADNVADSLSEVFTAIEPENARPTDKVDFIADKRANAIFIAASPKNMAIAQALVAKVDTPPIVGELTKSFPFANRRVLEVGETIQTIAQNYLRQKGLPTEQIQIQIDAPTNQVIVTALEADMKFIESIVENLDVDMGDEEVAEKFGDIGSADIMVVPLRHTGADELATLINLLLERAATGDTPLKDFIRRFRLLDENGQPLATVNLDRPTLVFGEPESNSLIIASSIENCMVMRQVAMALDKEATKDPVEMQTVPLTFADATEVATKLSEMLDASAGLTEKPAGGGEPGGVPDGQAGAIVYKAIVKADARTNQVVVVGRPDTVEILTGLIGKLDIEGRGVMPFEIVKLNHAQATGLAEALTDLMDQRKEAIPMGDGANAEKSETVVIVADARSESLILAAKRERLTELKELISKLDVPATALIDNIRTIKVVNGIATDLADKLQELWDQRQQNEGGGDGGLTFDKPAIVADERSNSLIVVASESDFESIKTVVEKIDNLELNPAAGIYIVQLKHNSASELAGPLTNLFQARAENRGLQEPRPEDSVTIEADPATNSLIFVASKENHDLLMQQLEQLDRPIGVEAVIEFFPCENVFANSVKDALDNLFPDVFKDRVGDGAVNENRETLSVVVDERANMLIVSASPENMEIVRRVYDRMNSVAEPWTPVDFEIVRLENTEAKVIASQLETALEDVGQQSGGGSGGSGSSANQFQVKVLSDPVRNSVIIGGTRDGIRLAMKLIRDLDRPVNPNETQSFWVKDYALNQARAGNVGDMLTNIFQAREQAASEGGDGGATPTPVTIEINDPGNSLLVNANSQDHAMIAGLIAQLDRSSVIDTMFRVFPLSKAKAETVKEILDEIYQGSVSEGAGGGGGGNTITTVAEERTNSIVVAVPPGELENIESLVNKLDSVQIKETALVEVIRCDNEDANKMAELLNEIMTGQAAEGGGGGNADSESARALSSLLIQYTAKDQYGNRDILQTVRENVQITYNERSNSVIVVAPPTSMSLIKKLVRELDSIEKREVMVRVFLLNNADSTAMVELLEEMFAQDDGADDQAAFQQGRQINVEGGLSDGAGGPGFLNAGNSRRGTFGRPRTTFVPDERTNAIIVAGWPEDIDVAGDIIAQLDSRDIQERVNIVYPLVNTRAEELQGSLDTYFAAQRDLISNQEDVSQLVVNERDVTVVAHEESNQLMVSTSPRYQAEVLRIIQQLDAPPPQVMIEVMIAEVSLDDSFEMGLEFALQQLKFSETATPGPNGIIQSNSFDFVGGTDLGAAGAGLGGFSFTITGEDFNFLVRALQTDSRLEVIQRPSIMCQTNQEANITIGENVPFVRGTTISDAGQTTAQVEYEEVGVILNVEPVINPDGFVYLRVAPEISSVSASNIPLGNGIFAPIITQQSAETTVAVKDGETVVIGGLITSSSTESESKVPGLGDVPGLGALFRTTSRSNTRSELLIALTPTIVRSVEDARRMSVDQRDLGGVITPNMKQSPLFRQLQTTPETSSEIDNIEVRPNNVTPLDPPSDTPVRPRTIPNYQPNGAPRYGPVVQPLSRPRSTTPPPTYRPTNRTNPVSRPATMERMVPVNAPAATPRSVPVHTANRHSSSSSTIPSRVAGTSSTNNMQPVSVSNTNRRVQKVRTAPEPQPSTTPQRKAPPKRPLYGPSPVVRVSQTPVRKVNVRTTPQARTDDDRQSEEETKKKRKPRATHR